MDPHNPDQTLNVTAVAVLHTIKPPQYLGSPGLAVVAQEVAGFVASRVRCHGLLLQRSKVLDGPILRTWVRAPVDLARTAVLSLNWRTFLFSELRCGTHVALLEFVRGLECLQLKTRSIVPFLIDVNIFYAMLKMSYGASYAP